MANLKTVIEIGGKIGDSFKGAFSSADDRLKKFGSSIKDANSKLKLIKDFQTASGDPKRAAQAEKLGEALRKAGVDTNNLSKEMTRLSKESEKAAHSYDLLKKKIEVGSAFKSAASNIALTGVAIGGALAAVGGSALALGQNVSNFIDDASDAAAGLGIDNVNNLLALQYAFADVGIEANETNALIAKFNSKVEESKDPASAAAKSLAQLGLTYQDFQGRSPEVQFQILAEAIKNAPEGLNKTAFSMELLGKKGFKALAKLKEGAGFFSEAQKAAKEAGFEITEEMEKSSDLNQKAFQKMSLGFRAAMNSVGSAYLPVITNTFGIVTKFLGDHKAELIDIGSKISRALTQALPPVILFGTVVIGALTTIFKAVDGLVQIFGGWGTVMELLGVYMGAVFAVNALSVATSLISMGRAAWTVVAGIGGISGAWTAFTTLVIANPIGATIAGIALAGYLIYKNWDSIVGVVSSLWDKLREFGSWVVSFFAPAFTTVYEAFKPIIDGVSFVFGMLGKIGGAPGAVLGSVLKNSFGIGESNGADAQSQGVGSNGFKAPELTPTGGKQTNITNAPIINVQVATNADPHQIGNEVSRSFQSGVLATGSYHA